MNLSSRARSTVDAYAKLQPLSVIFTDDIQILSVSDLESVARNTLSILTFNVWFSGYEQKRRAVEFLRILRRLQPDFVAVQESTKPFYAVLMDSNLDDAEWVRARYRISPPRYGHSSYGCLLLCAVPVAMFSAVLPTRMDRELLLAVAKVNDLPFVFSTVHLESLASRTMRASQLAEISTILACLNAPTSVLCGDFNFDSSANFESRHRALRLGEELENCILGRLLPFHKDVWVTLRPEEKGFTFDTINNQMVGAMKGANYQERMRYDRVMFNSTSLAFGREEIEFSSSSDSAPFPSLPSASLLSPPPLSSSSELKSDSLVGTSWQADSIQLVGTEPFFFGDGKPVYVSDHFGILTQFVCRRVP